MAVRRPLVVVNGDVSELPFGDLLPATAVNGFSDAQFYSSDRSTTQTFEWVKPDGAGNVAIFTIGAGGNGGDGVAQSGVDDGGGGGGSGGVSKILILAQFLPETLDVKFTADSDVSVVHPDGELTLLIANYGGNGQDGDGTFGGAGGVAAALPTRPQLSYWGHYEAQAGLAGGNGAPVLSNASDVQQTQLVGPGAGGASGGESSPFASGSIKLGSTVIVAGGATESNGGGGGSYNGIHTGGSGGGAGDAVNFTGQGGDGGDGAWYGCGGGGGGASAAPLTPGQGGLGGDAACWIISW